MRAASVLIILVALTVTGCAGNLSQHAARSDTRRCDSTLGPGQDVASALSSASSGSIVCLRAGVYPAFKLTDVHPNAYVTLRSVSARGATIDGIEGQLVDFLRFENLTVRGPISIVQAGHDLQFVNNDIGDSTCGIYLYAWSGSVIRKVSIRKNHIHDLDFTGPEDVCSGYGIEAVGGVENVSVSDNTIAHVANDYVQLGGGSDWTVAHNLFLGPSLRYSHPAAHQDLWQVFGGGSNLRFIDNVARHTATDESLLFQLGIYHNVTIANNLFDHDSSGYSVQLFQIQDLTFKYNTFIGSHWGVLFRADDPDAGPGQDYVVERNIFGATSSASADVNESRSFGRFDYNVSQDGSASGPHSLRHWHASWKNTVDFQPRCIPFTAGYHPTSSSSRAAFSRQWHSGCS